MDSLDGRDVLSTLARLADGAVRDASSGAWRCLRAMPRIDGSLYFDLVAGKRRARLNWLRPVATDGALVWADGALRDEPGEQLKPLLARLLEAVATNPAYGLLHFHNLDATELAFDDGVVDRLLADRFAPGRTRWFAYRFANAFQHEADRFQLTFTGEPGELIFEVRSQGQGDGDAPVLLANQLFSLHLLADPRPVELRGLVPHQVERFLGFLLSRAVHAGMRLAATRPADRPSDGRGTQRNTDGQGDPAADGSPSANLFDGAPVSTTRWGNPEQWYQFFSDFEVERSSLCSVRFTDPIAYVVHGEMECKGIEPETFGPRVDFANPPWPHEPAPSAPGSTSLFTGLTERDVVFGGTEKLDAALRAASRAPGVRLVCLNNTCLPKIIGDDAPSAVARCRAASPVPILSMNTDLDSPDAAFLDLVRQATAAVTERAADDLRAGLNLIGFPPGRGRRELVAQLEAAGLVVNCCLIPEFGVADLRRYLRGRAGLVYPHGPWIDLAERVLADLGVPFERLGSPYGLAGTRDLVAAAASALDHSEATGSWERRFGAPAEATYAAGSRRAEGQRLAFVVDQGSLGRLVDPTRLYGFSIAPLLEEMGFGLDVLVRTDQDLDGPPADLARALTTPDRHTFSAFHDPAELSARLRAGGFAAVYSEVFFDRRISRAGKAQFHLGMLELGLDGGLRGLHRLADLCEWPFYRRYRDYLGSRERTA